MLQLSYLVYGSSLQSSKNSFEVKINQQKNDLCHDGLVTGNYLLNPLLSQGRFTFNCQHIGLYLINPNT